MKPKSIVGTVLLLFAAATVVVLVAKGLRGTVTDNRPPGAAIADPPLADGFVVCYFHTNVRCPTCETIEAYATEAVQSGFAEQLEAGQMQWRVVNYDEPQHKHFKKTYELVAPSVIVVEIAGGVQKQWKDLHRVWELVGDKAAFLEYVQGETRAMLAGSNEEPPAATES